MRRLPLFRTLSVSLLLLAGVFLLSCSMIPDSEPLPGGPAHHTKSGFRNLYAPPFNKTFFSFLAMRWFGDDQWADHEALAETVPRRPVDMAKVTNPPADGLQITWIGHSTFLLQAGGVTILTDPIFADRASPLSFAGPKRYAPHVIDYTKLPKVDYVVISHDHYDHLDETAVKILGNGPRYLVPLRLKQWFVDQGIDTDRITDFDWWDKGSYPGLDVQAMPSQHWSGRSLWNRNATLWSTWKLTFGGKTVWFAGDTGYNAVQFKEIGKAIETIDLGLIPIGGYAPRHFMKTNHVNPEEAVQIHLDIGAKRSVGMHWGAYPLTAEPPMEPTERLDAAAKKAGLPDGAFRWMELGETAVY